jgi:hypothetical protein
MINHVYLRGRPDPVLHGADSVSIFLIISCGDEGVGLVSNSLGFSLVVG